MANWQGLLSGLQRGANTVSGLLYPGFDASGVDPRAAQAARAQAMMQMGAGLLGGQTFGQAYGLGQASGYEPIEQARREALMRSASEDRKAEADWRNFQRGRIESSDTEAAAAKQAQNELLGRVRVLVDQGNYEGASKELTGAGMFSEAAAVRKLGAPAGLSIRTMPGPNGGTILTDDERWQYIKPERPSVVVTGGGSASQAPPKPLPTAALRIVDEANQAIAAAQSSKALVDSAITTLQTGGVELGAARNLESRARNFAGVSSDNSRAYADLRQTLEKLRNNYLLLAKGVQTEGDAVRAWNSEIGENVQNDNALALQQLTKAQAMIDRALEAQNARIETVYANYGAEPPATAGSAAAPKSQAAPGGVPQFATEAEAETAFKAGKIMRGQRVVIGGVSGRWQ